MTQAEAEALADDYQQRVRARTGLTPEQLVCPREKSDMTPCVARDGRLAAVRTLHGRALCVGCEAGLESLLQQEEQKNIQG